MTERRPISWIVGLVNILYRMAWHNSQHKRHNRQAPNLLFIDLEPRFNSQHNRHNRQAPNLLFIDLEPRFKSIEALNRALKKTLKFIKENLGKPSYHNLVRKWLPYLFTNIRFCVRIRRCLQ
ncbi:MAG: hypothetical protein WA667_08585 [Candidatus Nitrosopolaris sp.]